MYFHSACLGVPLTTREEQKDQGRGKAEVQESRHIEKRVSILTHHKPLTMIGNEEKLVVGKLNADVLNFCRQIRTGFSSCLVPCPPSPTVGA